MISDELCHSAAQRVSKVGTACKGSLSCNSSELEAAGYATIAESLLELTVESPSFAVES